MLPAEAPKEHESEAIQEAIEAGCANVRTQGSQNQGLALEIANR
jgi:hypothetical protein